MSRREDGNDSEARRETTEHRNGPEIWAHVQAELRESISQEAYAKWIRDLKFIAEVDGAMLIAARDQLSYDRVRADHRRALERCWQKLDPKQRPVRLECWSSASSDIRALIADPWAVKPDMLRSRVASSMTFKTLVVGPSNEVGVALAHRIADGESLPTQVALLSGPQGVGKTHILRALEARVRETMTGVNILYMTAEEFMARYHAGVVKRDTSELKTAIRSASLLLIDDLQWIAGKPGTDTEFFANIRAVTANGGTVVLTADAAPGNLRGLSPQLHNEIKGALSVEIEMPDQEMRREIVRVHAGLIAETDPNFTLGEDMLERIVRRVRGPGRNLCGTLGSLYTETGFGRREPTMEMLDRVILRQEGTVKPPTIDAIKRATMQVFSVSKTELESPCKEQAIVYPRQIAMYLCRKLTSKSFPQIGRSFGKRDHTTVIYAIKRITARQVEDPDVEMDVERVAEALSEMQTEGKI